MIRFERLWTWRGWHERKAKAESIISCFGESIGKLEHTGTQKDRPRVFSYLWKKKTGKSWREKKRTAYMLQENM